MSGITTTTEHPIAREIVPAPHVGNKPPRRARTKLPRKCSATLMTGSLRYVEHKTRRKKSRKPAKAFSKRNWVWSRAEEKTPIPHIRDGFDFLGYHLFRCDKPTKGNIAGVFMQPTGKSLKRIKQKMKEMTGRKTLNDDYLHK